MSPRTEDRTQKSRRIEMRVSTEEEELLALAADLSHVSKTAFILSAAAERAQEVIQSAHQYQLSAEVFDAFVDDLDAPRRSIPELVDLFKNHLR